MFEKLAKFTMSSGTTVEIKTLISSGHTFRITATLFLKNQREVVEKVLVEYTTESKALTELRKNVILSRESQKDRALEYDLFEVEGFILLQKLRADAIETAIGRAIKGGLTDKVREWLEHSQYWEGWLEETKLMCGDSLLSVVPIHLLGKVEDMDVFDHQFTHPIEVIKRVIRRMYNLPTEVI